MPFALRWLQAQLPLLLGKAKEGAEQLYNLLDYCRRQHDRACSAAPGRERFHAAVQHRRPQACHAGI